MPFVVSIPTQDLSFTCEPSQTVLDAALEHGIVMSYGCRNGQCGSCRGSLLRGRVEYPEGRPDGISDEEIAAGEALFCKAIPGSDLEIDVQVAASDVEIEVKTLPVKVASMDYLTDDVVRMMLQLPAMESLPFKAGQWIYFVLRDGRKRAFSLANSPNDKGQLELQIRHAPGGVFTEFVFNQMKPGDLLQIEGPHGSFWHQPDDRPTLMVAGGTGFAPIKGIIEEMLQSPLQQPVHLFWGSRALKDLYQDDLARQWQRDFAIDYTPVLSDPAATDNWHGETGFVHEAVLKAYPDLTDYAVYMAGPPQMIESCKQGFIAAGLDEARLYYDSFDYSADALNAMKS